MAEYPDGFRRMAPSQNVDLEPGFVAPFYATGTLVINASGSGTSTFTFSDPDFIYIVDEIHISPSAFTEFAASYAIDDINVGVLCTCGYGLFTPRNNPSIMFLDGEHLDVTVVNLDASQRTFTVRVSGTKIVRPDNFGKPPYAMFSADNVTQQVGVNITFSDDSLFTPTSWLWDFGDGNTSTDENPVHAYSAVGSYNVTLTATNQYGHDTLVSAAYITIVDKEALTTYTEVDPNTRLLIEIFKASAVSLQSNEAAYCYKDFGADYFDAIEIIGECKETAHANNSHFCFCSLANGVGELYNLAGVKLVVWFERTAAGTNRLYLGILSGTTLTATDYFSFVQNTLYYYKLEHAAGSTTATLKIYSDAARTVLVDTLTITHANVATKFRYLYAASSYNNASASAMSAYNENMEIVIP